MSALTPQEWQQLDFGVEYWGHASLGSKGQLNVRSADKTAIFDFEARHKLAALALFQMDFGFTQEDAALVKKCADGCDGTVDVLDHERVFPDGIAMTGADWRRLHSLAQRITALLPPTP